MEEGKLSHLRIQQREGTLAETDEKPGEKDGEKGGEEVDSEETWEPRDLNPSETSHTLHTWKQWKEHEPHDRR